MLKKLSLVGLVCICMLTLLVPLAMAYWVNGSSFTGSWRNPTDLHGEICGARGLNTWYSWAQVDATITQVECYCRNKPFNSWNGKASHFIGTNYTVSFPVSSYDVEQDVNGCYSVDVTITDEIATAAAGDAGFECPNVKNWHLYCRVTIVETDWTVWYGRSGDGESVEYVEEDGVCEFQEEGPDCAIDDSCSARFFDLDPKTGIYDFETDCQLEDL